MAATSTIIAAAAITTAVASVGTAAYTMTRKAPDIPAAPPPASYYSYGEDGRVTEQVWDASKNSYVSQTRWESPEKEAEYKAEQKKREGIRKQMLDNIAKTPEDRVKAYEEYAKTFSESMHRDVDPRFEKLREAELERMERQGLTGSKAYADILSELNKEKTEADTDISEKAALAKEELANTDRNYWLTVLQNMDAGARADTLESMQRQKIAQEGANQATAGLMGAYAADASAKLTSWKERMENLRTGGNTLSNTATGLAFLYGYNKGGSNVNPGSGAMSPNVMRAYQNQNYFHKNPLG